jgi:broad specificity phosphatase PhoE
MKHVYLIRHGETLANRKQIHQGPYEPLSVEGRTQAEKVASFLRDKNIDTLVCSTYTRARETAEIIGEKLCLPFILEESVIEFKRPNRLYGRRHYSVASLLYVLRLFLQRENQHWNDDGAENMFMIRNRIVDTKTMLSTVTGKHIAVVTHDVFMNIFLEMICREKSISFVEFVHVLLVARKTPNTGIMHLYYDEEVPSGVCQWQVMEYIDPRIEYS